MSAVNEWIVREFFESHGFLVSQPRKYVVPGRSKTVEEELDLVVINPTVTRHTLPDTMIWTGKELKDIARAVVAVRGWHSERFYATTFASTPDILRFAEPRAVNEAAARLGSPDVAKILCLTQLPASGELKEKTLAFLREKGISGILSFRGMLQDLLAGIDRNRNYEKSDLLQILRILKSCDLISDSQMDFFKHRRTSWRKSKPAGAPASE